MKPEASYYLYHQKEIVSTCQALQSSLPGIDFLYSVKANPFPPVVRLIAGQSFGADAASLEEVEISLRCGIRPEDIFYSAPGKTEADICGVLGKCILIADSLHELALIERAADERNTIAEIGIRIHPDFTMDADQVQKQIFCCADNHWVMSLRAQHFADRGITYGFHPDSDYQAVLKEFLPQGGQSFEVLHHGKSLGDFKIRLMGEHNVCNAAAVIALLTELGYSSRDIADSIKDFTGARRRQELLFSNESYRIIDDYGHHPAEIRATIRAVKRQGGRLLVVFQPHRFSRTQLLLNEFSTCFEGVDQLLLTDVYAASENPIPGVSGECMAQAIRAHGQQVEYLQHLEDVGKAVERISKPGDVILFLGAGDITRQAHQYADGLRKGKAVNE